MPEHDPLTKLRDLHLPEAVSAWPPAPGWWILALLLLAALLLTVYRWRHHRQKNLYRRLALQELVQLQSSNITAQAYLQSLNGLLKQTVQAASGQSSTASMSGQQWLHYLNQSGNTNEFTEGVGEILLQGPYQAHCENYDQKALTQLVKQWIKGHQLKNGEQR